MGHRRNVEAAYQRIVDHYNGCRQADRFDLCDPHHATLLYCSVISLSSAPYLVASRRNVCWCGTVTAYGDEKREYVHDCFLYEQFFAALYKDRCWRTGQLRGQQKYLKSEIFYDKKGRSLNCYVPSETCYVWLMNLCLGWSLTFFISSKIKWKKLLPFNS